MLSRNSLMFWSEIYQYVAESINNYLLKFQHRTKDALQVPSFQPRFQTLPTYKFLRFLYQANFLWKDNSLNFSFPIAIARMETVKKVIESVLPTTHAPTNVLATQVPFSLQLIA